MSTEQLRQAFYLVDTVVTLQTLCQRSDNNATLHNAAEYISKQLDGLDVQACDLLYYAFTRGVQQEHLKWSVEMSRRAKAQGTATRTIDDLVRDARKENAARG